MNPQSLTLLLALWASPFLPAQGGSPFFVHDLNQVRRAKLHGSNPRFWTEISGRVLFTAKSPTEGEEIYVTQGTAASTRILKILRPGFSSAQPKFLGKLGKLAFFTADDGVSGKEIWVTDGTTLGTHIAVETLPGPASALVEGLGVSGSFLFFSTKGSGTIRELWRTDGTSKGTQRVLSYRPSAQEQFVYFSRVKKIAKGYLFFLHSKLPPRLYLSNGSPSGTRQLFQLPPTSFPPSWIAMESDGTRLFFTGYDAVHGQELWTSDGTQGGTRMLKDLLPGSPGSQPGSFQVWNQKMTFIATGPKGLRKVLWTSDGTAKGTQVLGPPKGSAARFQVFGTNLVLFVGSTASPTPPWIYAAGKAPVQVQIPGKNQTFLFPSFPSKKGLLISLFEGSKEQLWSVDVLSGRGTFIAPWTVSFLFPDPGLFAGGRTYLAGKYPLGSPFREPFVSDGTAKGTRLLKELYPRIGTNSVEQLSAFSLGDASFFFGKGIEIPWSHWGWQGQTSPARLLGTWTFAYPQDHNPLLPQPGFAYAFLDNGQKLYRLDAKSPYQTLIFANRFSFQRLQPPLASLMGGKLYFQHPLPKTQGFSAELFVSDGTPKGTGLLKDLLPGPAGSGPSRITTLGKRLFFAATLPGTGEEPWVSDGTAAGTKALGDLVPGRTSSSPAQFVRWDGRAWFLAQSPKTPALFPYFTDSGGTRVQGMLKSRLFSLGLSPKASLHPGGRALYILDPQKTLSFLAITRSGTGYQIQNLLLNLGGLGAVSVLPLGNKDLIMGTPFGKPDSGAIWISDGTWMGTRLVWKVSLPRRRPPFLLRLGTRRALFSNAGQLWTTDGTVLGTKPITPNPPYTNPRPLAFSQGLLLFAAEDLLHGIEPWAWFPGAHGLARGQGCGGRPLATPELEVQDPVMGKAFQARGQAAPPRSAGLLLLGAPGTQNQKIPGTGLLSCRLFLDLSKFWLPLPPFATNSKGAWSQNFMAPYLGVFYGLTVRLQALFPKGAGRFELTNAYDISFGN